MRTMRVRSQLVGVGVIVASIVAVQAVLAAPPNKSVAGTAYVKSGFATIDNTNHTTVITMDVPAGKYHVTARMNAINQLGSPVNGVACNAIGAPAANGNIDTGDASNIQSNGWPVSFPIDGVVALTGAGTIHVECISDSTVAHPVNGNLVAVTVADIINP